MKLQLAQLGLLRSDQQIFAASLDESLAWIARYFDPKDTTTIAVVDGIRVVRDVNVAREMPDVSMSLREVRKLLTKFHEQDDRRSVQ